LIITDVKTTLVKVPYGRPPGFRPSWLPGVIQESYSFTIVQIFTDEGITGIAGTTCFGDEAKVFVDREIRPILLNKELESTSGIEGIWGEIRSKADGKPMISMLLSGAGEGNTIDWGGIVKSVLRSPWNTLSLFSSKNILLEDRPWFVNVALWDLIGKKENRPVCDLIGRKKDKIKVYASTGEIVSSKTVEFAMKCLDEGFKTIKLRAHHADPDKDLDVIKKVKDAVGGEMEIGVDANQAWTVLPPFWSRKRALEVAKSLDRMGIAWFEEPVGGKDFKMIAEIADAVEMPIMGGELQHGIETLEKLLDAYDIVNPDISMSCGISDGIKIAEMARKRDKLFTPHAWQLGPGIAANLQVACVLENCPMLEYPYDPNWSVEQRDLLLEESLIVENGYLEVPKKPGLGVEINESIIEKYTVV